MSDERFVETADAAGFAGYAMYDVVAKGREEKAKRSLLTAGMTSDDAQALGTGWLEAAASVYNVSKDIRDYVIAPVSILISSIPNRNGVAFPLRELAAFDPDMGMLAYETWSRRPIFYEHANEDHTKALGVIFATNMKHCPQYQGGSLHAVNALCGVDRTRNPLLANRVLMGDLKTWSMGASIGSYECAVCGHKPNKINRKCEHFSLDNRQMKVFETAGGVRKLAHYSCGSIRGFETSMVEVPAWASAQSEAHQIMSLDSQ